MSIRSCLLIAFLSGTAWAVPPVETGRVREAVARGLAIVQTAAKNYPQHRDCFSCHHQALPLLAMRDARLAGVTVDEDLFAAQTKFTRDSFTARKDSLQPGKNVGGRGMTASYGLWTLQIAEAKSDETAREIVAYLLRIQEADGSWKPPSHRPPLEESVAACTVLAAYGLQQFADESQRPSAKSAADHARTWLSKHEPVCHEDRVFQLWGLLLLNGTEAERLQGRERLLAAQNADGSWSQQITPIPKPAPDAPAAEKPTEAKPTGSPPPVAEAPAQTGDAYATGETLWVLRESGVEASHEAVQRGMEFLLKTQKPDGSWHVVTRSKPIQVYFDNGDPHGKDQFISIPATAWATAALAKCVEPIQNR